MVRIMISSLSTWARWAKRSSGLIRAVSAAAFADRYAQAAPRSGLAGLSIRVYYSFGRFPGSFSLYGLRAT